MTWKDNVKHISNLNIIANLLIQSVRQYVVYNLTTLFSCILQSIAPLVLLYRDSKDRLMPIAIQLQQKPCEENPVNTIKLVIPVITEDER